MLIDEEFVLDCRGDYLIAHDKYSYFLNNKRVALVGPAKTTQGLKQGGLIDSFDVVVRMNNANLFYPFPEYMGRDIGNRWDVWYTHTGLKDKLSHLKWVEPKGVKKIFKHEIPCIRRAEKLFGASFTVGMSAIFDLCLRPVSSLFITGFTFCLNGDDDHIFYKKNRPLSVPTSKHNLHQEAELFVKLAKCPIFNILPDQYLSRLL